MAREQRSERVAKCRVVARHRRLAAAISLTQHRPARPQQMKKAQRQAVPQDDIRGLHIRHDAQAPMSQQVRAQALMGNVPRVTRAANGDAGRQHANILSPAAAPRRQIVRRRVAVKIVVHLIELGARDRA